MADLTETLHDSVAMLTMNRPARLNAITTEMVDALLEALPRLGADARVRAIVLTGAGRGFCSGADVQALAGRTERSFEERLAWLNHVHRIPLLIATLPKVVLARVNGVAAGAGLSLALACDLRIAGAAARFTPAFAGIGLSGDYGASWTLTHLVGGAKAREICLLNETLDAAAALACGLVNRVVDDARLDDETAALAKRLADGPTIALGYMKRNLLAAASESFAATLELEALHTARTGMSEDHREAVRAFAEKRKPVFRGR